MASPTLSFAVPTNVVGGAASSAGIQSQADIGISFEIDEEMLELAIAELVAQAEAAGLEMEMKTSYTPSGIIYNSANGSWPDVSISGAPSSEGLASVGVWMRG